MLSGFLAAATLVWQQNTFTPAETSAPETHQHLPQWQGKEATIWTVNPQQKIRTLIVADSLTHYKMPQRTLAHQPRGTFRNTQNTYHFEAREGILQPDRLTLKHKAHAEQSTPAQPSIHLYSDILSFTPSLNRLSTPVEVKITQAKNWVTGIGLTLDTRAQVLEIQRNVISHYAQD